jgi:hypothetical protein
MTETTVAEKPKLPRKSVQITYSNGDTNIFDSLKSASEETGHSTGLITRLAATGEADGNGDKFALVDYVSKKKRGHSIPFSDSLWTKIEEAATAYGAKPEIYIVDIMNQHLNTPEEEAA